MLKAHWNKILQQGIVMTAGGMKARFRGSVFGFFWVILNPLALYTVQAYVFKTIFEIQVQSYLVFLLLGLVPWLYFSQTLEMVTTSFQHNSHLLKSSMLHPFAMIASTAMTNMINAIAMIFITLIGLSLFSEVPWTNIYLFPLPLLNFMVATVSLGFALAVTNIFFNDTKFVLSFLLGILFFATPVIYPERFVPDNFNYIIKLNPLVYLLRPFRTLLEQGPTFMFWQDQLIAFVASALILLFSIYLWRRVQNAFFFYL